MVKIVAYTGKIVAYTGSLSNRTVIVCGVLALLCILAYMPSLSLPLLEDDYANIWAAQHYGSLDDLPVLFHDAVARVRATVYWTLYLVWSLVGFTPYAFRVSSLILHIFDTWLVYAIALEMPRFRAAATWAAGFFAIAEGHQEAMMWVSGNSEVLQWFFGGASLLCWMRAPESERRSGFLRLLGVLLFALALLSKESAFIFLPFFALVTPLKDWRKRAIELIPYVILASIAVVSVALTRAHSFRFSDGSFSLHAPVWLTLPRNFFRVLWIWGVISAAFLALARAKKETWTAVLGALAWVAIGLVPYSFLTYSKEIPSRQLYLASIGLSLLFGLAMVHLSMVSRGNPVLIGGVVVVVLAHNLGYIWIKKQRQFLVRARPTEQLIEVARRVEGPILVECFPRHPSIADAAIYVALNRVPSNLVFSRDQLNGRQPAAVFCYREPSNLAR